MSINTAIVQCKFVFLFHCFLVITVSLLCSLRWPKSLYLRKNSFLEYFWKKAMLNRMLESYLEIEQWVAYNCRIRRRHFTIVHCSPLSVPQFYGHHCISCQKNKSSDKFRIRNKTLFFINLSWVSIQN